MGCYCDAERPTIYRETPRTARKPHKCCECHEPINQGQPYIDITGLWDGAFGKYRTCEECHDLRAALMKKGCFSFGEMVCFYIDYLVHTGKEMPDNHISRSAYYRGWIT